MRRWFWIVLGLAVLSGIAVFFGYRQCCADASIATWKAEGRIADLEFSPDGMAFASAEAISQDPQEKEYVVRLRKFPEGQIFLTLEGQSKKVYDIAFSHDGKLVAVGDSANTIYIWRVQGGELLFALTGHTKPVQQVAFSPDDSILASVGEDESMRIWDMRDGSELAVNHGADSDCIMRTAFSVQDQLLASRDFDGAIAIQYINNPQKQTVIQGRRLGECRIFKKNDLVFTPDNEFLLSLDVGTEISYGRNTTMRLWRIRDGQLIATFLGHTDNIESVAFSPDGRLIASASGIPYSFAHTNGDLTIRIWDTANGELLKTFHNAHYGVILGLSFSPDGQTLLSGSVDGKIKLWSLK